eukprot:4660121-Pyramimonas_sp.AAC.1
MTVNCSDSGSMLESGAQERGRLCVEQYAEDVDGLCAPQRLQAIAAISFDDEVLRAGVARLTSGEE